MKILKLVTYILWVLCIIFLSVSLTFTESFVTKWIDDDNKIAEHNTIRIKIFQSQMFLMGIFLLLVTSLVFFFDNRIEAFNKKKNILKKIILFFGVLIVIIILLESGLRLLLKDKLDAEYGRGPGLKKFMKNINYNNEGFRDYEWQLKKEKETHRIIALGDSMTFGIGIKNQERFTNLLNKKSNKIEVLNFGIGGFSTKDQLNVYRNIASKYKPDTVIIAYYSNDAEDTKAREKFIELFTFHTTYPYEVGNFLYSHSYSYYFFESRVKNILTNLKIIKNYQDYIDYIYSEENPYLEEHKETLQKLIEEIKSNGSNIIIFSVPIITPDGKAFNLPEVEKIIGESCQIKEVYCIDLVSEFNNQNKTLTISKMDSHINEAGNKIIADLLYGKLKKEGIIS